MVVPSFLLLYARARTRVDKQTTTHKKMCTQEKFLPGDVFVSEIKKKIKINLVFSTKSTVSHGETELNPNFSPFFMLAKYTRTWVVEI